ERQHEAVVGRGGLQLEVERDAETLAEHEPPRPVDAAAERRVDHELLAARLVEEALGDARRLRRHGAERGPSLDDVGHELRSRLAPRSQSIAAPGSAATSSRKRPTATESSRVRDGASPIQNGIVGGDAPASSTRMRPASTRRMRHDLLPSRKMSPRMLSTAKS